MPASPMAILALDNSGTLSIPTVADVQLISEGGWDRPVPEMDDGMAAALVTIDHGHIDAFAVDRPIGAVVEDGDVPLYVSLSTVECSTECARRALATDRTTAARTVVECTDRAIQRTDGAVNRSDDGGLESAAVGAQVVVDLHGGRAVRVIGYTSTPLPGALEVIEWASGVGFEPHVVSGDTAPVLRVVAETVGIAPENVHAYQSPGDKGETIEGLRETSTLPVVMVGDHVNDQFAFEAADIAVFVDDEGYESARRVLAPLANATISQLSDLPAALDAIGIPPSDE